MVAESFNQCGFLKASINFRIQHIVSFLADLGHFYCCRHNWELECWLHNEGCERFLTAILMTFLLILFWGPTISILLTIFLRTNWKIRKNSLWSVHFPSKIAFHSFRSLTPNNKIFPFTLGLILFHSPYSELLEKRNWSLRPICIQRITTVQHTYQQLCCPILCFSMLLMGGTSPWS